MYTVQNVAEVAKKSVISIPATSDMPERVFSAAGLL